MRRVFRIKVLVFFLLTISFSVKSQVWPKEGSVLNYRIIEFFKPSPKNTTNYSIEIAAGSYTADEDFRNNIIKTTASKSGKIIAEVPSFGRMYTWRAVYTSPKSGKMKSELHHFSTGSITEVDTNQVRLRITQPPLKFNDAYVFLDGNKVLYDMEGRPVWYLPLIEGRNVIPTDLKTSQQGTITFLADNQAYEINYDGEVLWKAPNNGAVSGDSSEHYHHEFTRLGNGHYMVLGFEFMNCQMQSKSDSTLRIVSDKYVRNDSDGPSFPGVPFGTIIEYDSHGNVVWSWKSSKYCGESDLVNYKNISYRPTVNGAPSIDLHENAFFFDEKDKTIYVSFKTISRVVKLKYPEGTVIDNYGELYKTGIPFSGNGFFCGQHSCKRSPSGCVFLFNNNGCSAGPPKIKKFEEPANASGKLKKIWEYQCTVESPDGPRNFPHGGNVVELPDQSIFACMGSNYGKTFIVNSDKKILWSALPEQWNETEKKWMPIAQYRASIIDSRKDLERLILNSEKNLAPPSKQAGLTKVKAAP